MAVNDSVDAGIKSEIIVRDDIREPPSYRVVMFNDNITTMDFVVRLLCGIFNKDPQEANAIMLEIHNKGRGVCGIYTREIAEAKVARVHNEAFLAGFPLKCAMQRI